MGRVAVAARERRLDVQDLEPPEPLERVLAALPGLQPGEYLRMLHRREPLLLYEILEASGYRYAVREGPEAPFEILIWREGDTEAEEAARTRAGEAGNRG